MHEETTHQELEGLRAFIEEKRAGWNVPGLAIAIVRDGHVIFSEGFGYSRVQEGKKVTPQTVFAIASVSKAFTTMSMGMLVDEGRLDWDTPVRHYLPDFRLHDSYASEHLTPRDMASHRSGLPRHDVSWLNAPYSRAELVERLRHLEPSAGFRSTFQYQNLMYTAAGHLVGEIAGTSWESFVQARIFHPLGMEHSSFSIHDSQKSPDFALPYGEQDGEVVQVPFMNMDAMSPAGGVNSTVTDLAKWIMLHLNKGSCQGKQLVSRATLLDMHTPQTVIKLRPWNFKELPHCSYGLGWYVEPYRGHNVVRHGGAIDGFSTHLTFMPEENIGMVILTNLESTSLPSVIAYSVYDRLLGLDRIDWDQRIRDEIAKNNELDQHKVSVAQADKANAAPPRPLDEYSGDFEHPGYGKLTVRVTDGQLRLIYNTYSFTLTHHRYDVFEAKHSQTYFNFTGLCSFFADSQGHIERLSLPLDQTPGAKEIVFTRIPEPSLRDTRTLEKFAGDYAVGQARITITLGGDTLFASVPGLATYELIPCIGTAFKFKGADLFRIEFRLDDTGAASGLTYTQPTGICTANKQAALC